MTAIDQLTAALWSRGIAVAEPPTLRDALNVEFYARFKSAGSQRGLFDESDHPRGQPKNSGQFAEKQEKSGQKRASKGGEYGPNSEWYKGGAFIATTDMPKKTREKRDRAASGKVVIEPGKYELPEPGKMSVFDALIPYFNCRDGQLNEQAMGYYKETPEERAKLRKLVDIYKSGERWVDTADYPERAKYSDLARMAKANMPIPGELLTRMAKRRGANVDQLKSDLGVKEKSASQPESPNRIQQAADAIKANPKKLPDKLAMEKLLGKDISKEDAEAIFVAVGIDDLTASFFADESAEKHGGRVPIGSLVITARHELQVQDREGRLKEAIEHAGNSKTLELRKDGSEVYFTINPSTYADEDGQYQLTRWDEIGPSGHHNFKTRDIAIAAAIGASESPYYDEGDSDYRITQKYQLRAALQSEFYARKRDEQSRVPKGRAEGGQFAKKSSQSDRVDCRKFLEGSPVVKLSGNEIPHFPKTRLLAEWIGQWFQEKHNGKAINPILGEVQLDKRSAKDSASHGMSRIKELAFAAIPAIIEKGRIVHEEKKGGMDGYFLAAPITIADEAYVGVAIVRKDANIQRFYLHEVGATKRLQESAINTGAPAKAGKQFGANVGAIESILRNIFSDKEKTENYVLTAAFQREFYRRNSPERYKNNFLSQFAQGFAEGMAGGSRGKGGGAASRFEEQKHPRQGRGKDNGGQFAPKGSGGGSQSGRKGQGSQSGQAGNDGVEPQAKPKPAKQPAKQPKQPQPRQPKVKKPIEPKGDKFAVRIGNKRFDILRAADGKWLYKPKSATPGKLAFGWDEVSPKAVEHIKERVLEHNKAKMLQLLDQNGTTGGRRLERMVGMPKDDYLDAFFALSKEGKIHQNRKNGQVGLGKAPAELPRKPARQPQPDYSGMVKRVERPQQTPEEIAAEEAARKKAAEEAEARRKEGAAEAAKAQREENMQRLTTTAEEYGISPDDLSEMAKEVLRDRKEYAQEREAAKSYARKSTGLTLNDVKRMENAGIDYSTVKTRGIAFDAAARVVAREYPHILGNPDGNEDLAAGLWDLLREGVQPLPSIYDPEILAEAARSMQSGGSAATKPAGEAGEEEFDFPWEREEIAVPEEFFKQGNTVRYALSRAFHEEYRWRQTHRRNVERYRWMMEKSKK